MRAVRLLLRPKSAGHRLVRRYRSGPGAGASRGSDSAPSREKQHPRAACMPQARLLGLAGSLSLAQLDLRTSPRRFQGVHVLERRPWLPDLKRP